MLPSIKRKEWQDLIIAPKEPVISSNLLQTKINTLRRRVKYGMLTPKQAIKELYSDCEDNSTIYQRDLFFIFHQDK